MGNPDFNLRFLRIAYSARGEYIPRGPVHPGVVAPNNETPIIYSSNRAAYLIVVLELFDPEGNRLPDTPLLFTPQAIRNSYCDSDGLIDWKHNFGEVAVDEFIPETWAPAPIHHPKAPAVAALPTESTSHNDEVLDFARQLYGPPAKLDIGTDLLPRDQFLEIILSDNRKLSPQNYNVGEVRIGSAACFLPAGPSSDVPRKIAAAIAKKAAKVVIKEATGSTGAGFVASMLISLLLKHKENDDWVIPMNNFTRGGMVVNPPIVTRHRDAHDNNKSGDRLQERQTEQHELWVSGEANFTESTPYCTAAGASAVDNAHLKIRVVTQFRCCLRETSDPCVPGSLEPSEEPMAKGDE